MRLMSRWPIGGLIVYHALDQHGQVIDVLLLRRRNLAAVRHFFNRALRVGAVPVEVTTDQALVHPRVLDELIPSALHVVEQYANNPIEADHGRLKSRLGPMRGLKQYRSARILAARSRLVQNPAPRPQRIRPRCPGSVPRVFVKPIATGGKASPAIGPRSRGFLTTMLAMPWLSRPRDTASSKARTRPPPLMRW